METSTLTSRPVAGPADRARQVMVLVGGAVAIGGAALGSGAFGGQPIGEGAGGALSAQATLLAPDTPAFAIWSVIYLGLAAFAVAQALPGQGARPRLRATAWWILASMVLNAGWIGVVQAGWLGASVLVILALLAVLATLFVVLVRRPPTDAVGVLTDVTIGLYLGWVSVATLANIVAFLVDAGVGELGLGSTTWAVLVLALAAALAISYAAYGGSRLSVTIPVALAMAWGLAWIAIGRHRGPLGDDTVALAAAIAAVIALVSPLVATARGRRALS